MNNTEQQLFLQFYNSLAPEVQRDIKHYLFVYDMYLDERDPKAQGTLLMEMHMLERKYNLEVTHGNKNNQCEGA
ncbi:hypothetical protein [Paenibacillus polymyxa]|jgi:hypothetical protein|uniref:hypothetical protein n=1 Tax=Paenibacillus polymyxa TaxID=1406 RepID=UPI00083E32DE|nr:hypothetical protein [Paenibacillus polymyxa]ODB61388.1 hypothetical protein A7309_15185 [Paenibacillus polymyxa]